MKKMIYAGNNEYGRYVAEDVCSSLDIEFLAIPYSDNQPHYLEMLKEKIIDTVAQIVIIDLSELDSSEEIITETIDHIRMALNCNIIIFCPGYEEYSKQITSLHAIGIVNFIYEGKRLGAIKEALISALNNPEAACVNEEIINNRENIHRQILGADVSPYAVIGQQIKKIGVVGCMSRIGTTTTALQLVKYLNMQSESSACYIQMRSGYVENIRHFYNVTELADSVLFNSIRLYGHPAATPDILKEGFIYLVYDYGSIDDADEASMTSLLERDIIIAVGGTGPDELCHFPKLINQLDRSPVTNYVLNFVANADRVPVLDLMRDKAEQSHFLEYTPDPFVYNIQHNEMFRAIMQTKLPLSAEQMNKNKPRKRLFGKGEQHGKV